MKINLFLLVLFTLIIDSNIKCLEINSISNNIPGGSNKKIPTDVANCIENNPLENSVPIKEMDDLSCDDNLLKVLKYQCDYMGEVIWEFDVWPWQYNQTDNFNKIPNLECYKIGEICVNLTNTFKF